MTQQKGKTNFQATVASSLIYCKNMLTSLRLQRKTDLVGTHQEHRHAHDPPAACPGVRPGFARYYLMRLGIGNELKRVALNPEFPYKLASVEEVLVIKPELRPPE